MSCNNCNVEIAKIGRSIQVYEDLEFPPNSAIDLQPANRVIAGVQTLDCALLVKGGTGKISEARLKYINKNVVAEPLFRNLSLYIFNKIQNVVGYKLQTTEMSYSELVQVINFDSDKYMQVYTYTDNGVNMWVAYGYSFDERYGSRNIYANNNGVELYAYLVTDDSTVLNYDIPKDSYSIDLIIERDGYNG